MAQTNHEALGQGLKLYTDAMRELIGKRLPPAYPNRWWEQGVLRVVSRQQQTNLKRDRESNPDRHLTELLEPTHFRAIVTGNKNVFGTVFPKSQLAAAHLDTAAEARNSWAHPRSDDILADDAAHGLYAMAQLLAIAKLPEAEEIEAIRKRILYIEDAPTLATPTATQPKVSTVTTSALPYWWQACEPREGFRDPGQVDEGLFAATLGGVFAGAARDEYLDPALFLSQTYFTENLTLMLRDVLSRMNGGPGAAVTEVQTPFGGGKTHALLTLYHIINSPSAAGSISTVRAAMGDFQVPERARVLVFDGQEVGADTPVSKEDFASVSTLWGELGHQAGCWPLVQDADGRGTAPGNELFRQVLEAASPCLILLDELVSYLVKLRFSNSTRTKNLYRQTIQFLQETLQLAGNVDGVCILLSLPKSKREFGGIDPGQLQRELDILEELQPRADRVVSKRTPVNDEEIYRLTRQRLFEHVNEDAAQQVARAYRKLYEQTPAAYDAAVTSPDYLRRMEDAWPLHPELLDVIYKKWSTASDFPRTRATLQLLASVVAEEWRHRREAHAIQPAHIDLERERIRTRIVSAAGAGGGYDGVVAADIIGGDGHANREDDRRGDKYAQFRIARGVATTLLAHSFGGLTRGGATVQELQLGSVAPNLGPEYVSEVLNTLEETLWYVHKEGNKLRFQTKPNIYRVIAERASSVPGSAVDERLREEVERAIGAPQGFRTLAWAGSNEQIPDNPESTIAVLPPRFAVASSGNGEELSGVERIEQLWDRVGSGLHQWRNALILVAPDQELWERAGAATREVLAYTSVVDSDTKELSPLEVADLKSRAKDKSASLATSVVTAYRWACYPDAKNLSTVALAVPATAGEKITERAVKRLASQDYGDPKVLPAVGALYFNAKIAPNLWEDEAEPLALDEAYRHFQQWTYLPILPEREATLRNCIREGIASNLWAVAIGDPAADRYLDLIESTTDFDAVNTLFDGSASLVKGKMRELIREELRPDGSPQPPLTPGGKPKGGNPLPEIPPPARRLTRVKLGVGRLPVTKTNNLQQYLFRVLQEEDAAAELELTIHVKSERGISQDVLTDKILEAFDQLGLSVDWNQE